MVKVVQETAQCPYCQQWNTKKKHCRHVKRAVVVNGLLELTFSQNSWEKKVA